MTRIILKTLLLFGLPMLLAAANVTVTCFGVAGTTVGNKTSCFQFLGLDGAMASASVLSPGDYSVSVDSDGPDSCCIAVASISGSLEVLVTGGTGGAWLLPCLYGSTGDGHSSGGATFDGIVPSGPDLFGASTCDIPPLSLKNAIPITFGMAITGPFSVSATGDSAGAIFGGFLVLDSSADIISTAVVTVTDITAPEPAPLLLSLLGASMVLLCKR